MMPAFPPFYEKISTGYSNSVEKNSGAGEVLLKSEKGPSTGFFPDFGPFLDSFSVFSQAANSFPHDLSTAVETAVDKFTVL